MSDELKPCPFCGGEADEMFRDAGTLAGNDPGATVIWCETCNLEMSFPGEPSSTTVAAWNTRTPSPRIKELEEALEAAQPVVEEALKDESDGSGFGDHPTITLIRSALSQEGGE